MVKHTTILYNVQNKLCCRINTLLLHLHFFSIDKYLLHYLKGSSPYSIFAIKSEKTEDQIRGDAQEVLSCGPSYLGVLFSLHWQQHM